MSVLGDLTGAWLQRHPRVLRVLFGALQRCRPLARIGSSTVIVTRADDAREVLERGEDFEIGPVNGRKMLFGPFLLGLDPYPRYLREHATMRAELEASAQELQQIARCVVARYAEPLRGPLLKKQPIDAVQDFAERVTTEVAAEFFGVPCEGATSRVIDAQPGSDTLRLWLRKLGSTIASPAPAPFGLQVVAESCTRELVAHVQARLAELKRSGAEKNCGLLGRLVRRQAQCPHLTDDTIVRNVVGLMLAGSAAIAKAFTHALDQLLRRPEHLEIAIHRAQKQEDAGLLECVREALRFNPTFPLLVRYCPRPVTLAAGTPRQLEIPAGATLYVSISSAMFDPEALEQPDTFGYGRDDDGTFLHFGFGTHRCLGKLHAEAELLEMFRAFLTLPGVGRAAPGRLRYDGPAVDSYLLRPDSLGESLR